MRGVIWIYFLDCSSQLASIAERLEFYASSQQHASSLSGAVGTQTLLAETMEFSTFIINATKSLTWK